MRKCGRKGSTSVNELSNERVLPDASHTVSAHELFQGSTMVSIDVLQLVWKNGQGFAKTIHLFQLNPLSKGIFGLLNSILGCTSNVGFRQSI